MVKVGVRVKVRVKVSVSVSVRVRVKIRGSECSLIGRRDPSRNSSAC